MALREMLAEFGIDVDTKQLDHANEKIEGFIGSLKKTAMAVAGAFAVKEVFEFAEQTAHAIHQVEATAAALGISTQATQEFGYAANAAGMETGELLNMMGRLQVTAANPAGAKAFKAIGVDAKDANGHIKSADVLLEDVAEGLKKTEDPAKRAAAAVALFGRQGRVLLPFLIRGKAGIEAMRKEFGLLGGGFDEEAIEKSAEFEHSMAKVKVVVDGIKGAIVKGLFPILGWLADKAAAIGGWFVRMTHNTNAVRNALIMLGVVLLPLAASIATALWAAFAPLIPAALAVASVYLIFDDLITLFEGGHSLIGKLIDKAFGKGTSAKVVQDVKDAWVEVKDAFVDMWPYVKKVYDALKWIVENTVGIAGALGGAIGDTAAQATNNATEQEGAAKNKAGITTNAIGQNAKAYLDAKQRGEDVSNFHVPNIPKGMTAESALAATMAIVPQVNRGDAGFAQFQPRGAPQNAPAGGGDTITVQIAGSTGMKEHEVKRAVADGISEARQRRNRDAKHVVSQAGQKP